MIRVLEFNATPQYIPFDFEDSYSTCCCFLLSTKRLNPKTRVYINSSGIAEKFDSGKSVEKQKSRRKSMSNLNVVIRTNAFLAQTDVDVVRYKIGIACGILLDEDSKAYLTIGLIEKINSAIKEIFQQIKQKNLI